MTFIFWTVWKDPKNVIEHILGPWLTSVFWLFSKKKKSSSCDIDAWNSVNRILGQEKTSTSAGRQLQLMTSHPPSCFLYNDQLKLSKDEATDKRTDVWSRDFIIWKINSGLWAGLDCEKKKIWIIRNYFRIFWRHCRVLLKSCIE